MSNERMSNERMSNERMSNETDVGFKQVELWYVRGVSGEFFTTKMAAEVRARAAFPHEDTGRRYARVFYKRFFEEV